MQCISFLVWIYLSSIFACAYADFGRAENCRPVKGLGSTTDVVYRCDVYRNITSDLDQDVVFYKYKSTSNDDIGDGVIFQNYLATQVHQSSEYTQVGSFAKGVETLGMLWMPQGSCQSVNWTVCNQLRESLPPGSCFKALSNIGGGQYMCFGVSGQPDVEVYDFGAKTSSVKRHQINFHLNVLGRESETTYDVITKQSKGDVQIVEFLSDFVCPDFSGIITKQNLLFGVRSHHINGDLSSCASLDVRCLNDAVHFDFDDEHQQLDPDFKLVPNGSDFNLITEKNHTNHFTIKYVDYLTIKPAAINELRVINDCLAGKVWVSGQNIGNPMKIQLKLLSHHSEEIVTLYADDKFNTSFKAASVNMVKYKDTTIHVQNDCTVHVARAPSFQIGSDIITDPAKTGLLQSGGGGGTTPSPTAQPADSGAVGTVPNPKSGDGDNWFFTSWAKMLWIGSTAVGVIAATLSIIFIGIPAIRTWWRKGRKYTYSKV